MNILKKVVSDDSYYLSYIHMYVSTRYLYFISVDQLPL